MAVHVWKPGVGEAAKRAPGVFPGQPVRPSFTEKLSSPQIKVEGQMLEPKSLILHWGCRGRLVSVLLDHHVYILKYCHKE